LRRQEVRESCYHVATDMTDEEPAKKFKRYNTKHLLPRSRRPESAAVRLLTGDAKGVVSPTGFEGFCQVGTDSWGIQFQGFVKAA
jgi:hypothetical protein